MKSLAKWLLVHGHELLLDARFSEDVVRNLEGCEWSLVLPHNWGKEWALLFSSTSKRSWSCGFRIKEPLKCCAGLRIIMDEHLPWTGSRGMTQEGAATFREWTQANCDFSSQHRLVPCVWLDFWNWSEGSSRIGEGKLEPHCGLKSSLVACPLTPGSEYSPPDRWTVLIHEQMSYPGCSLDLCLLILLIGKYLGALYKWILATPVINSVSLAGPWWLFTYRMTRKVSVSFDSRESTPNVPGLLLPPFTLDGIQWVLLDLHGDAGAQRYLRTVCYSARTVSCYDLKLWKGLYAPFVHCIWGLLSVYPFHSGLALTTAEREVTWVLFEWTEQTQDNSIRPER